MLSVNKQSIAFYIVMLSVIMLNGIMLSVIVLSVVAPTFLPKQGSLIVSLYCLSKLKVPIGVTRYAKAQFKFVDVNLGTLPIINCLICLKLH
jgi:hypothetical protein